MKCAGVVSLIVLGSLAVYVGQCAWYPFAACWRCGGDGKFRSSSGRSWRKCRRCGGSGERIRAGRRIWNYLHKTRDNAQ